VEKTERETRAHFEKRCDDAKSSSLDLLLRSKSPPLLCVDVGS